MNSFAPDPTITPKATHFMHEEHMFPRFREVLTAVRNDPDVLIMDLARFRDDFLRTVQQLFSFVFARTGPSVLPSWRILELIRIEDQSIGQRIVGPSADEDATAEALKLMSTHLRDKLEHVRSEILHMMHLAAVGSILASPAELGRS